jgi:uncharacterized protein (UPF0548 family)
VDDLRPDPGTADEHPGDLPREQADRLSRQQLTYAEVGATRGPLPLGYHHVDRTARIGAGQKAFDRATAALLGWELQRRAGVRVLATSSTVTAGADAVLLLGLGPLAVRAPVRVVYVVDEPTRRGFAYGTLPGHPESGEELFLLEQHPDGEISCYVKAFSRHVSRLSRCGGPLATLTQTLVTTRYLHVLRNEDVSRRSPTKRMGRRYPNEM